MTGGQALVLQIVEISEKTLTQCEQIEKQENRFNTLQHSQVNVL